MSPWLYFVAGAICGAMVLVIITILAVHHAAKDDPL